jgi:hypothetical protein
LLDERQDIHVLITNSLKKYVSAHVQFLLWDYIVNLFSTLVI